MVKGVQNPVSGEIFALKENETLLSGASTCNILT